MGPQLDWAERLPCKQKAGSSNLPGSTTRLSSNGRMRASHARDAGSSPAGLTNSMRGAEAAAGSHKPRAPGSIPGHATIRG
jgi:hypothetical protein